MGVMRDWKGGNLQTIDGKRLVTVKEIQIGNRPQTLARTPVATLRHPYRCAMASGQWSNATDMIVMLMRH